MPFAWFMDLFKGAADEGPVGDLYANIVAQARCIRFYQDLGVADSLDGRFDMIALHYFLAMDRMRQDQKLRTLGQKLANLVIADMDRSLREMGVGDLRVGRKVQDMGLALYGRMEIYDYALMQGSAEERRLELGKAVMRNIFRSDEAVGENARKIVNYIFVQREFLSKNPSSEIAAGKLQFKKLGGLNDEHGQ